MHNYSEDPNEAVKEVLKQILDEENKKAYGASAIPKFTKDIIKQELLNEKT